MKTWVENWIWLDIVCTRRPFATAWPVLDNIPVDIVEAALYVHLVQPGVVNGICIVQQQHPSNICNSPKCVHIILQDDDVVDIILHEAKEIV
jgi:hypothetical protein